MAHRVERLEKIFEREISRILLTSKDERLRYITITKVQLTADVSIATIYYTVIGTTEQKAKSKEYLEDAYGYIKSALSQILEIRKVPDLKFKYDESLEYGEKIENIIKGFKK